MNKRMERLALSMWGTITPTVEQVEASYGKFDKRDAYDKKFGVYAFTYPIDQAWLNDPVYIRRMCKLNVHLRVINVLTDAYLKKNGRMNDEAVIRFRGQFENLVEWILYLGLYTTTF